jgi:hypothetical protein
VVSYGGKTGMRASYQDATSIYVQRIRFYYSILLITRTKSPETVSVADHAPTDEMTVRALSRSHRRVTPGGDADLLTPYPPRSIAGPLVPQTLLLVVTPTGPYARL